jgi:hypothetical protein
MQNKVKENKKAKTGLKNVFCNIGIKSTFLQIVFFTYKNKNKIPRLFFLTEFNFATFYLSNALYSILFERKMTIL